ncbi:hypothetical protein PtA15_6A401 [Puccinia triticina]|uniref:Uncharacterized protein n=1 Tax=Puccinia triticina TaxID=208348 RepID=A0ABY7CP52_9BASI|nr:uncharacterized protein PtA15_6A401 [Puccinia triticina]WAQ85772.1 hypothetical protein PtA15_6A401 [Puccinia triticina]
MVPAKTPLSYITLCVALTVHLNGHVQAAEGSRVMAEIIDHKDSSYTNMIDSPIELGTDEQVYQNEQEGAHQDLAALGVLESDEYLKIGNGIDFIKVDLEDMSKYLSLICQHLEMKISNSNNFAIPASLDQKLSPPRSRQRKIQRMIQI